VEREGVAYGFVTIPLSGDEAAEFSLQLFYRDSYRLRLKAVRK